jgi:predicted membrane chloride channel (bestrophin family)
MFGKMVRASTSLGSLTATYISPLSPQSALLMGRYLSIYGWCIKGYFRRESDESLIKAVLPKIEAEWLLRQTITHKMDTPTCIHSRLRGLIASQIQYLPVAAANAMEDRLGVLESALGVSKRLLGSPIPPTYTRHTSRVLCVYLGLLPFALVGVSNGRSDQSFIYSVLVTIAATAYVFVGIDEIGVEIENPFPLLPMQSIASIIQRNIANQLRLIEDSPESTTKNY